MRAARVDLLGISMNRLRVGWVTASLLAVGMAVGCGADHAAKDPAQPHNTPQPQYAPKPLPYPQPAYSVPTYDSVTPGDPTPKEVERLSTPEEAEKAVAEAQLDLDKLFGGTEAEALGDSRCLRSCKALGSMRRAVDRLCELTGEGDERCENARERLQTSQQKVEGAGCSC